MKEIKDYLHLYLGCDVQYTFKSEYSDVVELRIGILESIDRNGNCVITHKDKDGKIIHAFTRLHIGSFKPILRPLSSMTPKEKLELSRLNLSEWSADLVKYQAIRTKWYLSKQFDLFGLIEAGLAIDATTLNNTP